MEIITLSGYTELEKLQIAKRYLVKKQRETQRLARNAGRRSAMPAIRAIINDYTREAGVRNLEREIGTVFRKIARKIAENPRYKARIKPENLVEYLSRPRFFNEVKKRVASVGVATGMAYTPVGGDILFIETQAMPGTGKLVLTGQLGDVMKESAQAAVSFLRSRSSELGLPDDYFAKHDIHIHVPAGATPKDGPSAGIALATSIASMLTGIKVDPNLAMTGEITLTGQVLADRRPQGEGARRETCGDQQDLAAAPQRDGSRRHSERSARDDDLRAGRRALRSSAPRAGQASDLAGAAREPITRRSATSFRCAATASSNARSVRKSPMKR